MRARDEPRSGPDGVGDGGEGREPNLESSSGPARCQRRENPRVLLVARQDLVPGAELQSRDDGVHAAGRGAGQGALRCVAHHERGHPLAQGVGEREDAVLEVGAVGAPALGLGFDRFGSGDDGPAWDRAVGPRVQVGGSVEDGELGAQRGGVEHRGDTRLDGRVILERSMHPEWLSNAYLVADEPGGEGVVIDAGGPSGPLLEAIDRHGLRVRRLLLTHHHHDHVAEVDVYRERLGAEVLAHPLESERLDEVDGTLAAGETFAVGALEVEPLHTPGHTAGMLSFRIDGQVFTGDTLFKGSVGGVKAPGATGFEDLRRSVLEVLMKLPPETHVHPGHTDPTTVRAEWQGNPFIRIWRGVDPESAERCTVWEQPATLVLFAPDYDGGHKAWVRWDESGKDDIVPGSQVVRQ